MSFVEGYFVSMVMNLIPFSLGTLLIVISPIIKERNSKLGYYSKTIGIIVSLLTFILIINNLAGIVSQFV